MQIKNLYSPLRYCIYSNFYSLLKKADVYYVYPTYFPSLARRFPFHFAPFGFTAVAKATLKGPGLDGLTEQSAEL